LAVQVMTGLADELDDRLLGEFGGRRFFDEEGLPSHPPESVGTGMYLERAQLSARRVRYLSCPPRYRHVGLYISVVFVGAVSTRPRRRSARHRPSGPGPRPPR